jgi:hypothetical protein
MAALTSDIPRSSEHRVRGLAPALLFFGGTFAFSWFVWLALLLRAPGGQADEVGQLVLSLGINEKRQRQKRIAATGVQISLSSLLLEAAFATVPKPKRPVNIHTITCMRGPVPPKSKYSAMLEYDDSRNHPND